MREDRYTRCVWWMCLPDCVGVCVCTDLTCVQVREVCDGPRKRLLQHRTLHHVDARQTCAGVVVIPVHDEGAGEREGGRKKVDIWLKTLMDQTLM